jgi:FtsH-binding integral membrane protein
MSTTLDLPAAADAELRLALERAHREIQILDRLLGLWGLLLAKCCFLQAAIERWQIPLEGWLVVWSSSLGLATLASVHYLRAHRADLAQIPSNRRVSAALTLGLVVVALGAAHASAARDLLGAAALGALIAALVGVQALVTAALRHRAEPLFGALLAWTCAALALGAPALSSVLIWTGSALLLGLGLPFLAMARVKRPSAA